MKPKSTRDGPGSFEFKEGTGPITAMCPCGDFLEVYKIDKTFRLTSPETIDPEKKNPEAPWLASPVSDNGSSNLIVARVLLQGHELLKSAAFDKNLDKESITLHLHKCKEALLACHNISDRLGDAIDKIVQDIEQSGIEKDNLGRALNPFPQVSDLETDCGTYLIHANRAIKLICALPGLFIDLAKSDTNFDYLQKSLADTIGEDAPLTELVKANAPAIRYLIELRNYHEHPNDKKTIIRNFHVTPEGKIQIPTWQLISDIVHDPKSIKHEMRSAVDLMMQAAEMVFIYSLMHSISNKFPFIIIETPADKIDKNVPIKYRLSLDTTKIGKPG